MKSTNCKSGIRGWQAKLQSVYSSFEEFEAYDSIYKIVKRLKFNSAKEAWEFNPKIRGSVNPSDLEVVR